MENNYRLKTLELFQNLNQRKQAEKSTKEDCLDSNL